MQKYLQDLMADSSEEEDEDLYKLIRPKVVAPQPQPIPQPVIEKPPLEEVKESRVHSPPHHAVSEPITEQDLLLRHGEHFYEQ